MLLNLIEIILLPFHNNKLSKSVSLLIVTLLNMYFETYSLINQTSSKTFIFISI